MSIIGRKRKYRNARRRIPKFMALMTRSRQSMPNTSKIFSMSYFFSSIALFVRVVQFVFTLNFTNFELLTALCEPDYEADNDRENCERSEERRVGKECRSRW